MENTQVLEVLKTHSYPKGYAHTVYIDEDIDEPVYYRNVINTLDSAQDGDSVRMIISTGGGMLDTANMITYAMDTCKAEITAVLTSVCKSAGTLIALHAHKWEIGAGLDWMVHSGSFGVGGETHSVQKYHDHNQRLMREMLDREYSGFYSEGEIEAIANGADSLLVAKEVSERLSKFANYRASKEEDQTNEFEEMMWQENNRMVAETLETLNISDEEKAVFNKVKTLLDNSLAECDNAPTEDSLVDDNNTSGIPLKDSDGGIIGVIDNTTEYPLVETFSGHIVDFEDITEDRESLLSVMSFITGRNYSKWATTALYNSFKREIARQIKENSE